MARNALEASLTISADFTSVRTRGARARVERLDRVAGPVAVVADDDAVGLQEVLDRRALLEELGAGDVAEALALLGEDALMLSPVPTGTVDFITSAWRSEAGIASTTACTARQVRVAGVRRRRADGDEQQAGVLERGARSVEKCSRSRCSAISSSSPGSQIGIRPASRPRTFSASMSTQ